MELGKIVLAYLVDPTFHWDPQHIDDGENKKRLELFRQSLKRDLTVDNFTTSEDLSAKVIQDLVRELPQHGFNVGQKGPRDQKSIKDLAKQMCELPRMMAGRELVLPLMLGNWGAADAKFCEAFSLTVGSSIRRDFKVVDDELSEIINQKHKHLYAQNELALALAKLPADEEVTIRMKMAFGIYKKIVRYNDVFVPFLAASAVRNPQLITRCSYEDEPLSGFLFAGVP